MKFEYLFSDTQNIFTGLRVDGSYLSFWTNFKESMIKYIDIELLLFRKVFPKEYTFIGVYNDQSEHDEQYLQLHADLNENNPLNWLSNNNIGPHYHFKCTRNGEACEITPHLLKQLLITIASYQRDIKERKQFQKFAQEKMAHLPSESIQTEKFYFSETEIDIIHEKAIMVGHNNVPISVDSQAFMLTNVNNSKATIELTILCLASTLLIYLLCFRSKKNRTEKNRTIVDSQSRSFISEQKYYMNESTNLSAGNGNVSALIALSILSGAKQSIHPFREMRDQIDTKIKKFNRQ